MDRVKKYAPSFSKKATGAEILSELEKRGVLPKGYGEYYTRPPAIPEDGYPNFVKDVIRRHIPNIDNLGLIESLQRADRALIPKIEAITGQPMPFKKEYSHWPGIESELRRLTPEQQQKLLGLDIRGPISRDQLVPYLEENWVNPRIDVRSKSGYDWIGQKAVEAEGRSKPLTQIMGLEKAMSNVDTYHSGSQTIFGNQADDYFELLLKPRRGLEIPTPEKLAEGGHWDDPSVMAHIRGETVGPRAIVQEVQGDWNRIFREAQKFKQDPIYIPTLTRDDPAALDFIRNNRDALIELGLGRPAPGNKIVMDFNRLPKIEAGWYGPSGGQNQQGWFRAPTQEDAFAQLEKAREVFGNVPPLPPELSKAWPEVGAKAALAYAARDPNLQRVSFVDDLIAASARNLDPEKTQGIYGARLPQFLRKYVPKYGGEYRVEPFLIDRLDSSGYPGRFSNVDFLERFGADIGDTEADSFIQVAPAESVLHTIELGDWNSPFRKFLRGQQPIAMVPLLAEALRQMQNSQNFQNPQNSQELNQVQP